MKTIDLQETKLKINEFIDSLTYEVINDFLSEIKTYAENGNTKDIEITIGDIKELKKTSFELKQKVLKSDSILNIIRLLNSSLFLDVDEMILSKILNEEIVIKK